MDAVEMVNRVAENRVGMRRLHARYPFLDASRDAVREAGVDLADLVASGGPVLERATGRVERSLVEGTAAPEESWPTQVELFSYPVARVLVALLDVPGAIEKYAHAEADLAHDRFVEDFERDLQTGREERLALTDLLSEFDLESAVTGQPPGQQGDTAGGGANGRDESGPQYYVEVTAYLRLAGDLDGEQWQLTRRALRDGRVPVDRGELYTLLREAVHRRVEDGLADLAESVPAEVRAALDGEVSTLREALAEVDIADDIDTVVPGLFPPCMRTLLARAREEGLLVLPEHSRFELVAFLTSTGLDARELVRLCGVSDPGAVESVREQVARLRDDRGQFAPPSCETMVAYDDCVNKDELCETITHPMAYYEERLAGAPGEKVVDWRET